MIDTVQAVLLFVIVLLTILLVVIGVQVYFVLRDLRKTLSKANNVLDNTEEITGSVSEPMSAVSSILFGTSSLSILKKILGINKRRRDRED